MADLSPYPDSNLVTDDKTGVGPDRGSITSTRPSTPRWVKVFGIIVLIAALLFVVVMVTGVGGQHGPGRHMPSSGVTQPSVQQP